MYIDILWRFVTRLMFDDARVWTRRFLSIPDLRRLPNKHGEPPGGELSGGPDPRRDLRFGFLFFGVFDDEGVP